MGEHSGRVRSTVGAYTVLEVTSESGGEGTVSLPNSFLLHQVVTSGESGSETRGATGTTGTTEASNEQPGGMQEPGEQQEPQAQGESKVREGRKKESSLVN